MLIKLEMKRDCKVTGLSFHGERPWVLACLYNGMIELWDYSTGLLIDSFRGDRKGPVCSVHFHKIEPLFVSGGDDCEVKVWSYKLLRCTFSLLGHSDRINSVQFHENEPLIISGSNDKTVRIWNRESRTCICVFRLYTFRVLSVSFHLKEYLALSVLTDHSVRVWDIALLIEKPCSFWYLTSDYQKCNLQHRRVTWASFHPSLPLVITAGNNCRMAIFDVKDKPGICTVSLTGHMHGISSVIFHARQDVIVYSSQDKTIRAWDLKMGTFLGTLSREETFCFLASHPSSHLLGAGHDNGFIVFKLARERPAFSVTGDAMLYVKNRVLHVFDYLTLKDVELMSLSTHSDSLSKGCRALSYNPSENAVLICSDMELDYYELYTIPKECCGRGNSIQQAKGGIGGSSVFVARNRFAVLNKSCNQVFVKNLKNHTVKKIVLPIATDIIFSAGSANLLCRAEDRVVLFNLQQQIVLGDIHTSFVRHVVWSDDMESCALLSKYLIVIADRNLVLRCKVHEKNCVKSGTWDENGIFVYTTKRHIKYCLPNGETGIIKTVGVPKYITKIYGSTIFCLDQDGKICPVIIDSTEYMLKLSLLRKRYDQVGSMIRNSKLCGQSMVAYLQQKGFPELALHFVKDERTCFNLALKTGNIRLAIASAKQIDEEDYWNRLGAEALSHGKTGIAEYVYQKTKNFGRLSFLYLITGNLDKLSKLMKTAEFKNDVMSQIHYALYLGDIEERVKILENAGHLPLAYITASVHGLRDTAEHLAVTRADDIPCWPKDKSSSLLMIPPKPILCGGDWSSLTIMRGFFRSSLCNSFSGANLEYKDSGNAEFSKTSVVREVDRFKTIPNTESSVFVAPSPGIPVSQIWVEDSSQAAAHAAVGNFDVAFCLLDDRFGIKKFSHFKSLFVDLHLGSVSYLCAFPSAPVISVAMDRHWNEYSNPNVRGNPALIFNCSRVKQEVKAARELFMDERFSDAFHLFQKVLRVIPVNMVASAKEANDLAGLIVAIKNYLLVTKLQLKKRELKDNLVRQLELVAYATHVPLSTHDARLVLFNAMTDCYKAGNRRTAAEFARRLLHANPSTVEESKAADKAFQDSAEDRIDVPQLNNGFANLLKNVTKFVWKSSSGTDDHYSKAAEQVLRDRKANMRDAWKLNYDSAKTFSICGSTLDQIYEGQSAAICPYCRAYFLPSQKDQLCTVCDLAVIVDSRVSRRCVMFPLKYYSEDAA